MDLRSFQAWLDRYAEASRANSAEMARDLFAEDAVYVNEPFEEPWTGRDRILAEWEQDPAQLEGFECKVEAVAFDEPTSAGAAQWWASYPRYTTKEFYSALLIWFDAEGRCKRFVEYYRGRGDS